MSRRPRKKLDGLSFEEFRRQIKERRIDPLYLFVGEEQYLQERALRLLYNTIDESERVFSIFTFSIGETSPAGIRTTAARAIDTANEMTLMAARRIVVIRNFDKITEDENELVLEYLKRPSETATVVFQAVSLDQRRKVTTALLKTCTVVAFDLLTDQQAQRWAEEYLRRRDCRIESSALGHLIGLVGTRLARLSTELDKLAAYAAGGFINMAAIDQLVPRSREHTGFELWDAVMDRDRKRALKIAERLLDDGTDPVVIIGSLGGLYRRLLMAKELIARNAPSEEVMKATGQYGPRARVFAMRLNRISRQEIEHGILRIARADRAIKSSEATPRLQIEYLVSELTLPEAPRWSIFGF
ncbi:MAG TPA: DNA polymerase III subunit delta [Blastocatellia bacterium]|nr:DNA polymerase III subunit delta [Blastocatellia bacterium]